jgi:hypothetical protein
MIIFGKKIARNNTNSWGKISINFALFSALFDGCAMGPAVESVG